MAGWDNLKSLIGMEIRQKAEEGCNVDGFSDRFRQAGDDKAALMKLYDELSLRKVESSFSFNEPTDLDEIRKLRSDGPRKLAVTAGEEQLKDSFYGAWLGRSIGCALGKPLETGPYMGGDAAAPGWKHIKRWFEGADAWPIKGYTPKHSSAEKEYGLSVSPWCYKSMRENIKYMESDDDIRYTVLGLCMLEEKGAGWDTWDVGKMWHNRLPYSYVCTAETQAYLNFCQVTSHTDGRKPEDWQKKMEWVRTYLNPYREWIGAQIRVDAYAYAAAGNPEFAAELAWRDATLSHVKNGVYGAMFISAMISAAFVEKDPEKLVETGLSEIPSTSRLYSDIRKAVEIAKSAKDQVELVEKIWDAFNHYHCVHTNNNAALCAASVIFGGNDFEKAVTTAVLGGWDTDCNGATVGSIMGAKLGAEAIPESWKAPLNDTLYSAILEFHPIKISECAERSYKTYKKLLDSRS